MYDIPRYESDYSINKNGDVFNKARNKKRAIVKTPKGYLCVGLTNENGRKNVFIHRILAQIFIPNPENKPQINHKNGIKTDNRIENLEWVTNKENREHAIKHGLNRTEKTIKNCKKMGQKKRKLTFKQAQEIRRKKNNGARNCDLAKEYGVYVGIIERIHYGISYLEE